MIYSPSAFSGRPVIVCVQLFAAVKSNSFVSWRSICKESYGNALWTNAILVVSVIPDLGYRRAGLTWGVAVGDVVIIINSCCITRYGKLAYRVGNFRPFAYFGRSVKL